MELLMEPLDTTDVLDIYSGLRHLPCAVLLESGLLLEGLSRYSFVAADPFLVFKARGSNIELTWGEGLSKEATLGHCGMPRGLFSGDPLTVLSQLMEMYKLSPRDLPVPFLGGAVGYFSYDLGRGLERLPDTALDELGMPDLCLGFYDWVLAVDHLEKKSYLISTGLPFKAAPYRKERALVRLNSIKALLFKYKIQRFDVTAADEMGELRTDSSDIGSSTGVKKMAGVKKIFELAKTIPERDNNYSNVTYYPGREDYYSRMQELGPGLNSDFDRESYCRMVERAKEYIAAGDIFQVNLAQRFMLKSSQEPFKIYRRLRQVNPAPMAAFLDFGDVSVCCSSPERFLKVTKGQVETCPIKGTRPRGKDPEEDRKNREELWQSAKDRAELVMIVDLERNDLGRVCRPGTIRVDLPEIYKIETYATVFHLVSRVIGELEEGKTVVDLLGASFPGGSITGAPKIRAMEIIEEQEPVRRGIYCGSIGYLGFDGNADLNIVIRTLVFKDGQIHFHVGGGLTIDSNPLDEYYETLDKARALVMALGLDSREEMQNE